MKYLSILILALIMNSPTHAKKKKSSDVKVEMQTSMGTMVFKLYEDVPQHKANFEKLVEEGFYDSLLFHRVIENFMIQGGDPDSKDAKPGQALGGGDLGYRVPAEFNSKYIHKKGALAAARDNNPEKSSSACQFYVVQGKTYDENMIQQMVQKSGTEYTPEQMTTYQTIGGTPFLDQNYTVFGELVEGFEVLDKIAGVATLQGDRPEEDVYILSAKIVKPKKRFLFW